MTEIRDHVLPAELSFIWLLRRAPELSRHERLWAVYSGSVEHQTEHQSRPHFRDGR
jgi:hypothetical protein